MASLTWTPDLNTGINWIDEQHQQLVAYINELHAAQDSRQQRDTIAAVMDKLVDYTVFHFGQEEHMLERAGYPLTDIHKGVHQGFIDKLDDIARRYKIGQDTAGDLLALLDNWLFSHIRVNDRGYVASVKKAGAEQPVG